jgi:hypothetical protein
MVIVAKVKEMNYTLLNTTVKTISFIRKEKIC